MTKPEPRGLDRSSYILGDDLYSICEELQYVRFSPQGIQEIISKFFNNKKEYKINIETILLQKDFSNNQEVRAKTAEIFKALKEEEMVGVIITEVDDKSGAYAHNYPVIIAKKKDGGAILVEFRDRTFDLEAKRMPIFTNPDLTKKIVNFDLQQSHVGCAIFSLNTLKNCLLSERFKFDVFFADKNNLLTLPKRKLAHGSKNQDHWKDCYVLEIEGKKYNFADFYKGHYYALMLNPNHFSSKAFNNLDHDFNDKKNCEVNKTTEEIFFLIHRRVMAAKEFLPNRDTHPKGVLQVVNTRLLEKTK